MSVSFFLLVPAHPGNFRTKGRKTVVVLIAIFPGRPGFPLGFLGPLVAEQNLC